MLLLPKNYFEVNFFKYNKNITKSEYMNITNTTDNYTITEKIEEINLRLQKRLFQVKSDPIPEGKNQIHISMAIDNSFIFPNLVSIASGLYNNNDKENVIVYHLLCSPDFDQKNFEIFDSLKKRYEFSLNYYIIPCFFSKI